MLLVELVCGNPGDDALALGGLDDLDCELLP